MIRYTLDAYIEQLCDGPVCNADMDECLHGEWVKYKDAQSEIERLRAENEKLSGLLIRADDELHDMTQLDCPEYVERDEGLMAEIRAATDNPRWHDLDADTAQKEANNELPGALALALHVREGKWPHTMDAQVWAEKWLETLAEHPDIATDEGAMIGWFSNAIMAGYDQAQKED